MSEEMSVESTPAEQTQEVTENSEQSEQVVPQADPNAPPATEVQKEEVKSQLKKLNIKVDGEEIEEEIDVANEEQLKRMLQLAKMSHKRAQEAAELRKQDLKVRQDIGEFFAALQQDTKGTLARLGIDPKAFAEQLMNEELERAQMDPKELEIMELKARLKAEADAKEQAKKSAEAVEFERLREKHAVEFEKDLLTSLKENGLPENPEIINRAVGYMKIATQNKINLGFKDIMPLVKEQINNDVRSLIQTMDMQTISKFFGDDKLNELYKTRKKAEPAKKVVPPTVSSIKDVGGAKDLKKIDKNRAIDAKSFWDKI